MNRAEKAGWNVRLRGTRLLAALLLACATPLVTASSARACAVCFDVADRAREAYYLTTVLMIFVPFAILGAILFWLRQAMRRQAAVPDSNSSPGQMPRA